MCCYWRHGLPIPGVIIKYPKYDTAPGDRTKRSPRSSIADPANQSLRGTNSTCDVTYCLMFAPGARGGGP